jgi:hypothetical protein
MEESQGEEGQGVKRSGESAAEARMADEQERQQTVSAPSADVGTAEEADVDVAVEVKRRIRPARCRGGQRNVGAKDPAPEENPTSDNQGFSGPVPGKDDPMEIAAGQSQQDDADEIWKDIRIIKALEDLKAENNKLREDAHNDQTELQANLYKTKEALEKMTNDWSREKNALKQQTKFLQEADLRNGALEKQVEDYYKDANAAAKRDQVATKVIDQLKKEVASLMSDLVDITLAKHQLEEQKDHAEVAINSLHEQVNNLEAIAASQEMYATENASLLGQIAEVHTVFEDAFSDMAQGLTLDEKFVFVREQQPRATFVPRPRNVSAASLHEELNTDSDAVSVHANPAPKPQTLTLSTISSIETAPVAAVKQDLDNLRVVNSTLPAVRTTMPESLAFPQPAVKKPQAVTWKVKKPQDREAFLTAQLDAAETRIKGLQESLEELNRNGSREAELKTNLADSQARVKFLMEQLKRVQELQGKTTTEHNAAQAEVESLRNEIAARREADDSQAEKADLQDNSNVAVPLSFSGIVAVETAPVTAPIPAPAVVAQPAVRLAFIGIQAAETAPVTAPRSLPDQELRSETTRATLLAQSMAEENERVAQKLADEKEDIADEKEFIAEQKELIDKQKRRVAQSIAEDIANQKARQPKTIWRTEFVDVPVPTVPWWVWFFSLLALLTAIVCAGSFAALVREKQIWVDANDMAYQRLMGGQQETWIRWVNLGVADLLRTIRYGGMGHSLFG